MLQTTNFHFNSIKVRLKLLTEICYLQCLHYFNSIKVRLKPEDETEFITDKKFQFHKGTIKTPAF